MKEILHEEDNAVSPIIATILLIAITVVLAATLYSVIGGYTSYLGSTTPTASLTVTDLNTQTDSSYMIYISSVSPNGNISLSDVDLLITNSTGTVSEINLGFAVPPGSSNTQSTSPWSITVSAGNYLGENPVITVKSTLGIQTISYLELIDTTTHGTIATDSPSLP
ncbi:MAG: type IV pilin [Candidatus Thermoplasmatota archaeon]|jgi:flagellin-like protein|nr:type IV pilin [Candidatus Thermoplasmatota archaeon]